VSILDSGKPVNVLLVEDDPEDVEITRRAFSRAKVRNPLYVVRDGEEAMAFLKHTGPYSNAEDAPRPGLILLDLNLPRLDGREVLRLIKVDAKLGRIPVVVLTTSSEESDVLDCYDSGANTYITKPVDFRGFLDAVVTLGRYWLSIAEIPEDC
jgi:CheY-like chemotaxis protein